MSLPEPKELIARLITKSPSVYNLILDMIYHEEEPGEAADMLFKSINPFLDDLDYEEEIWVNDTLYPYCLDYCYDLYNDYEDDMRELGLK